MTTETKCTDDKRCWQTWQLAFDEKTYGTRAGGWIITTLDGEDEVCGVIPELEAHRIVEAHNLIVAHSEQGHPDVE